MRLKTAWKSKTPFLKIQWNSTSRKKKKRSFNLISRFLETISNKTISSQLIIFLSRRRSPLEEIAFFFCLLQSRYFLRSDWMTIETKQQKVKLDADSRTRFNFNVYFSLFLFLFRCFFLWCFSSFLSAEQEDFLTKAMNWSIAFTFNEIWRKLFAFDL